MTPFGWFKRQNAGPGPAVRRWRDDWVRVLESPGADDERLREALRGLAATEPDIELETEMLDALDALRSRRVSSPAVRSRSSRPNTG
jgi:hypothetical protein